MLQGDLFFGPRKAHSKAPCPLSPTTCWSCSVNRFFANYVDGWPGIWTFKTTCWSCPASSCIVSYFDRWQILDLLRTRRMTWCPLGPQNYVLILSQLIDALQVMGDLLFGPLRAGRKNTFKALNTMSWSCPTNTLQIMLRVTCFLDLWRHIGRHHVLWAPNTMCWSCPSNR